MDGTFTPKHFNWNFIFNKIKEFIYKNKMSIYIINFRYVEKTSKRLEIYTYIYTYVPL